MMVRLADFLILICALITAGSTFAIAVELIFDWSKVTPMIEKWVGSDSTALLLANSLPLV
jgi:hypothetical protein